MADLISREEVKKTLKMLIPGLKWSAIDWMVDSIPPARYGPRWVPVSERLPEDGASVLVCCDGDITDGVHDKVDWWLAKGDRVYSDEEGVIDAWMPLPEPYKKGEQDG